MEFLDAYTSRLIFYTYLSSDVSGTGVTETFSLSAAVPAPAGPVVVLLAVISSDSSGHPKASFVFPYLSE